jgi:hypothetical protein
MAVEHKFRYLKSTSQGVVERVERRALTRSAAIRFHCLDCSGGSPAAVRDCRIELCPLWCFRPYQKRR